jgi:hypothetical protein
LFPFFQKQAFFKHKKLLLPFVCLSSALAMPDCAAEKNPKAFKDRTTTEYLVTTVGGSLLAFNAGFLNGTTMKNDGVSTTHVSGTSTKLEGGILRRRISMKFN